MVLALLLATASGAYVGASHWTRAVPRCQAPMASSANHEEADALFAAVDEDGNGAIDFEELRQHLETRGYVKSTQADHVFDLLDVNRDGEISRQELRESFSKFDNPAVRAALGLGESDEDWRQLLLFNSIDTDGDGVITRDELTAYCVANGFAAEVVESIWSTLDLDGDGSISRAELHEGYTSYSGLRAILGLPAVA